MNDLDLCLEVTSTIALRLTLSISETVIDRGLVPKDHQIGLSTVTLALGRTV